ncbi:hypothetical protein R1sor_015611 [Riccia sorocarpa]|uniref:Uncharacterized protein n=1 Tax=Riccia sorocarpa TaxID=122646 RepID=A0ABD3HFF1_9MARC
MTPPIVLPLPPSWWRSERFSAGKETHTSPKESFRRWASWNRGRNSRFRRDSPRPLSSQTPGKRSRRGEELPEEGVNQKASKVVSGDGKFRRPGLKRMAPINNTREKTSGKYLSTSQDWNVTKGSNVDALTNTGNSFLFQSQNNPGFFCLPFNTIRSIHQRTNTVIEKHCIRHREELFKSALQAAVSRRRTLRQFDAPWEKSRVLEISKCKAHWEDSWVGVAVWFLARWVAVNVSKL